LTEEHRLKNEKKGPALASQPQQNESAAPQPANDAASLAEPETRVGLRHRLAGALSKEGATELLQQTGGKLRELRNKGSVRVQRVLGQASTLLPPTPLGALCGVFDRLPLTAETLLLGYTQGVYPMDFDGRARWHCPPERFVVFLKELRISANMRRELKRASYTVTFDQAPREVLLACADREEGTWLSPRLQELYMQLFEQGAMHSV
jgi:hypothetical protein